MTPIRLEVLGDGRLAQSLRAHGAPLGRTQLVTRQGDAVLIDLPLAERARAVADALRRGAIVACPPPMAQTQAELRLVLEGARSGGRLICAGEIAHSEAGRRAIQAIAAPEFGPVRSLYLAIRQRRGPGDVIADLLPDALDPVLACLPGTFPSVRINAGALFGGDRDTAVILVRHESGAVVTLELSRCLPATLPAPGLGEVEIDAMGARQSVRVTPGTSAVRIYREDGVEATPWLNAPVLDVVRTIEAVADGASADGAHRVERAFALTEAIRAAL